MENQTQYAGSNNDDNRSSDERLRALEDIVGFCRVKENWFKEKIGLQLKNGVASHDTFQSIFAPIKPAELKKSFSAWTKAVSQKAEGEIVRIDGKTI